MLHFVDNMFRFFIRQLHQVNTVVQFAVLKDGAVRGIHDLIRHFHFHFHFHFCSHSRSHSHSHSHFHSHSRSHFHSFVKVVHYLPESTKWYRWHWKAIFRSL